MRSGRRSLPGTTKAKLVFSLPADHRGAEIAQEDPEVPRLAVESSLRARTLQEQCPGTCVRALHQKGAQPDCWSHQYQLDGVELACTSYAKAARQGQFSNPYAC